MFKLSQSAKKHVFMVVFDESGVILARGVQLGQDGQCSVQ